MDTVWSKFKHPGVYVIWLHERCFYVGQSTTSMATRLRSHLRSYAELVAAPDTDIRLGGYPCDYPEYEEMRLMYLLRPLKNKETKRIATA